MTITELAKKLNDFARHLESGRMQPDGVTEMLELSRTLHERMVVLQFKAFEEADAPFAESENRNTPQHEETLPHIVAETAPPPPAAVVAQVAEPAPEPQVETPKKPLPEPEIETIEEDRPAFRFGSPKPEVAPKQISLIDSIEEIKRMESSINDKFTGNQDKTLAHKLKKSPIVDLKTAIGINMRFQFTSALFANDAQAYNTAVERLNAFTSFLEADEYVQNNLRDRYEWQMKNPTVKEFMDLVERRYL